jgi:NAD-dependent dihydropyrimidine dehydrogenase PreA subunit
MDSFVIKANWGEPIALYQLFKKGDVSMAFNPIVDADKCQGCEECVDVCPVEVFEMVDDKSSPVNAEECLGCESCVEVCEPGAITIEET